MSISLMNEKKLHKAAEKEDSRGIVDFVGEIKSEFKKVDWTSKEELKTYTQIVVGAAFCFGIGVFCIDVLIQSCLHSLDYILKLITG